MELKPFDKSDWEAFAGAERSTTGEEPVIAYGIAVTDMPGVEAIVIADATGVQVFFYDEEGANVGVSGYELQNEPRGFKPMWLAKLIAADLAKDGEFSKAELEAKGFLKMG